MSVRVLERLLEEISVQRFLAEYYLKVPFARRGSCHFLNDVNGPERLDAILQKPNVDIFVSRAGAEYAGASPSCVAEAMDLLSEGYTVGIRGVERHDTGIAALAEQFVQEFGARVSVHLYCTPPNQPGLGWHYDAEEVFVLQTGGEKEWYLRKNTVNPLPLPETVPLDLHYEREIMPVTHCALAAGDWLYIPGGYWHRASSKQQSISLSIRIKASLAIDFYDFVRPRLLESVRWRQRLPPLTREVHSSPNAMMRAYAAVVEGLVKDLQNTLNHPQVIKRFLDEQLARASEPICRNR